MRELFLGRRIFLHARALILGRDRSPGARLLRTDLSLIFERFSSRPNTPCGPASFLSHASASCMASPWTQAVALFPSRSASRFSRCSCAWVLLRSARFGFVPFCVAQFCAWARFVLDQLSLYRYVKSKFGLASAASSPPCNIADSRGPASRSNSSLYAQFCYVQIRLGRKQLRVTRVPALCSSSSPR